MKTLTESLLKSFSGEELYTRSLGVKKLQVYQYHFLFIHGALEHQAHHERFFQFLLEHFPQACVSSFDLIGHGRSGGSRAYIDSFKEYIHDVDIFIKEKQKKVSAKKVILIGHSMGGLLALNHIQQSKGEGIDGFILVNPCLKLGSIVFGSLLDKLSLKGLGFLGKLRLPTLFSGRHLTSDEKIQKQIDEDCLRSSFMSYNLLKELVFYGRKVRLNSFFMMPPGLFLLSEADTIVDPQENKEYAEGLKKETVSIKWYGHCKHDLLNEVNRQKVYKDIGKWVQEVL